MKFKKWKLWFLVILLLTSSIPVYATNLEELEDSASDLENELSDLNSELRSLNKELDSIVKQINETSDTLEQTKAELAIAKGKEALGSNLDGNIVKEIYVPGRIINIVVK